MLWFVYIVSVIFGIVLSSTCCPLLISVWGIDSKELKLVGVESNSFVEKPNDWPNDVLTWLLLIAYMLICSWFDEDEEFVEIKSFLLVSLSVLFIYMNVWLLIY